jgi:osmotically-inducible protein OsmY
MDQSQSGDDVKVTAAIRRAIMDDKAMSMNAQNCKIITDKSGVVTLRGVVDSQAEKDAIQAKAQAVAGVTRVDNQLEVKTN